jgi:anaerobic magnesium-protoporphyrin IX monomethyl ester cyclase
MRCALINPRWSFEGSIYFGCREPHLPVEFGYSKALLEQRGHQVEIIDAQMFDLSLNVIRERIVKFAPDMTVITTAPSYLFWRCAPPELRVPQEVVRLIRDVAGRMVCVGPHGSTTPRATLRKLGVDVVVMGECEDVLLQLAEIEDLKKISSICYNDDHAIHIQGSVNATNLDRLPALKWSDEYISRHAHHHHRFDTPAGGAGAEVELTRGCPYHCTFCAKNNFRNQYRRRPLETVLDEIAALLSQKVEYIYFIDEIFMPWKELLQALVLRKLKFGIQMRIDLWSEEMLELLGRAGCVSIEAGVESITEKGRQVLDKNCKLSTEELADRLITAKKHVSFVQANLLLSPADVNADVERWRNRVQQHGVWANKPVPLFPYPGSPDYTKLWGTPDDIAWERAVDFYLHQFSEFSDIQNERPLPLHQLELSA